MIDDDRYTDGETVVSRIRSIADHWRTPTPARAALLLPEWMRRLGDGETLQAVADEVAQRYGFEGADVSYAGPYRVTIPLEPGTPNRAGRRAAARANR